MNQKWKLAAYAVLLILCAWFAGEFHSKYSAVTKAAAEAGAHSSGAAGDGDASTPASAGTNTPAPPDTNAVASSSTTNATPETDTNLAGASNTNGAATPDTNGLATAGANISAVTETNAKVAHTKPAHPKVARENKTVPAVDPAMERSSMITYLAAFVGSVVGLGLLIAFDVTQYMGGRAVDFLFNDAGEGQRDPEYERGEAEWANGKYLDAIQIMRDFLKKNPREIYAALRIAEIYEKDLRNYLAAALEYEEVLKKKLPAERWGWAAVHLCNLYSRLNQGDKALALLRRVADEYPRTGAAKKARARLGLAEPEPEATAPPEEAEEEVDSTGENQVFVMEEHPPELEPRGPSHQRQEEPPEPPEPTKSYLPSGFRPKK